MREIVSATSAARHAAQPFDDLLDIHSGGRLCVDLDDPVSWLDTGVGGRSTVDRRDHLRYLPSRVSSTPIPPNWPRVTAVICSILLLVHVIGMRIEPRQHTFQGVLGELAACHRRDIIPFDLLHRVLDQAEIGGTAAVHTRCAGSGAVAGIEGQRHQDGGGGPEGRMVLAGIVDHRNFRSEAVARLTAPGCRNVALRPRCRFQGERLIQSEAAGPQINRKALALGSGSLPCLVLRPPVEGRIAEIVRRALLLARQPISRVAAAVVGVDGFGEVPIVIFGRYGR